MPTNPIRGCIPQVEMVRARIAHRDDKGELLDASVPLVFHQSDLQAYNRCPEQVRQRRVGNPRRQSSRAAYGSVAHHALAVLRATQSLEKALATFEHYWHPQNIEAICPSVPEDGWVARDSYGSLRAKGIEMLNAMWAEMKLDEAEVLALEYDFVVPVAGTGVYVAGTIDELAIRYRKRKAELHIEDFKSGRQASGLRWNVQGTLYTYATEFRTFWTGLPTPVTLRRFGTDTVQEYRPSGFGQQRGTELYERLSATPRRFMWVNLMDARWVDGGYRSHLDNDRLRAAVTQLSQLERADVWPLRLDGSTCEWCEFSKSCVGAPLPDVTHGDPFAA